MTKRTNPRKDFTQVAHGVFQKAIGEAQPEPEIDPKKKNAVESGRKGGLIGGAARKAALSPEERSKIAQKAANSRWGGKKKK